MDAKSHELFTQVLLEYIGSKRTPILWGTAPDIDLKFFHRWYRHRISKLPQLYKDINRPEDIYTEEIAMCVVSHLYLDIFNGTVFPFGLLHPVFPDNTIINDVLSDLDKPNLLIEDLKNLSGMVTFSEMFYQESRGIMQEFLENLGTLLFPSIFNSEPITQIIVSRLALHSGSGRVYDTAMKHIAKFTRNNRYIYDKFENHKACEQFERSYADLIVRASGNDNKENKIGE